MAHNFRKMFFIGQNLKHVSMTYSFLELLIIFLSTLVEIFIIWGLFLTTSKKYCMLIQTPKKTNHEIKTKRYSFSLVSDNDVEKFCFLCRVKIPYQQFLLFLRFMHFQKQLFADILRNRCSKKVCNILN